MNLQNKESRRWLMQAERDLDDSRYNLEGNRYNVTCFLAQQAAEKALKACLYFKGAEEVWGHSVIELCEDAEKLSPSFSKIKKEAAMLDKYYIPTRYPNALPGGIPSEAFGEMDARMALEMAEKIINLVKEEIKIQK